MTRGGDRWLGFLFGVLGAVLIVLEGFVDFLRSAIFLVVGRPLVAWDAFSASLLFVVLGLVLGGFAVLGRSRGGDRTLAAGVVMMVLALLGIVLLGFGKGILGLLGAVFVLIGGLLYVVESR